MAESHRLVEPDGDGEAGARVEPHRPRARGAAKSQRPLGQTAGDAATALARRLDRGARKAHDDAPLLMEETAASYFEGFRRVTIDAPSITVDTTRGYEPTLEHIIAFVTGS